MLCIVVGALRALTTMHKNGSTILPQAIYALDKCFESFCGERLALHERRLFAIMKGEKTIYTGEVA